MSADKIAQNDHRLGASSVSMYINVTVKPLYQRTAFPGEIFDSAIHYALFPFDWGSSSLSDVLFLPVYHTNTELTQSERREVPVFF